MKILRRAVAGAVVVMLLIAGGLALLSLFPTVNLPGRPGLPSIRLPDGGQFQVVQVRHTNKATHESEHALGRWPRVTSWIRARLPQPLQAKIDPPVDTGYGSRAPALSVWWAYIEPRTGKPQLGETSHALVSTDSGRYLAPIWPRPPHEGEYRQIFLIDPPTDSRHLHFRLTVEGVHPVNFTIVNPAYAP